jgi:hypothetical protein
MQRNCRQQTARLGTTLLLPLLTNRSLLCCVMLCHAVQFLIGSVLSVMLWATGGVKAPKLDAATVGCNPIGGVAIQDGA